MADPARYRLVPIDSTSPLEGREARWCGHVVLPGEDTLHTVVIEADGHQYAAHRPACDFDGWRTYVCPQNPEGERFCSAPCDETNIAEKHPVVRIDDNFYLAVDMAIQTGGDVHRMLVEELDAVREANRSLEEQITAVSSAMDQIVIDLQAQTQQINERSREQNRLTQFVRRVMDTMDSPLIVLTRFGRIAQLNAAASRLFGLSEGELAGQSADVLLSETDKATLSALDATVPPGLMLFKAAISHGGLSVELELGGMRAEGHQNSRIFLLRGSPIYDPAGKQEGVVIVATDVTRLRERERALEASEQRFRDYSSMSTSLVWETDVDGRFMPVEAEDKDYEWIFKGRSLADLALPHEIDTPHWQELLSRFEQREALSDFETRIRTPAGVLWYSINGMPRVVDGEFVGYRGVAKDVSKRRRLADELRKHRDHLSDLVREQTADLLAAKEAAEHANRMKSEFLSNISHELRTPLHSILSFSRLGLKKVGHTDACEKIVGYFERIHTSGDRLTGLVDDLLNLAKLESGKIVLNVAVVDLGKLVSDVGGTLEALLVSRGQQLTIDNRLDEAAVRIDPNRFTQVLLNLIGNASKFSPEGGTIVVTVSNAALPSGDPAFRLGVADSGPGIPAEELEDVFGKFVQSSRTKTGAGGTGLGLAICRQIVLAHGGTVTAANRSEGGAVFEVLMPMETAFEVQSE